MFVPDLGSLVNKFSEVLPVLRPYRAAVSCTISFAVPITSFIDVSDVVHHPISY